MQKRAPTLANILVIALFALSCFGLLLFLWNSFGGSVPLKSKGYRFTADFPRTLELAEQSEVTIHGVAIGRVVAIKTTNAGLTQATMEVQSRYAPLRRADRAMIRQKTILGETYVQIIPREGGPALPNDGQLPNANVEPIVTLDGILSTFSPKVRHAFRVWMISSAESFNGQGEALNASFASLTPFFESTNRLLGALQAQQGAVRAAIKNTGDVFDALTEREGQLRGFVSHGEEALRPAAKAARQFAQAWEELPAFEKTSERALRSLDSLAVDASPLLVQLRPVERSLTPLLHQAESFAPPFDRFLTALGPLTRAARRGLPAVSESLRLTTPVLEALRPVLHNFEPFLRYTDGYLPSVEAFFAKFAAASNGHTGDSNLPQLPSRYKPHYLRSMQYVGPESLAVYPYRIGTNRANPYPHSGALAELASGLHVFESGSCADSAPAVEGPANATVSQSVIEQLIQLKVANRPGSSNSVPAPPCKQQAPFTFEGTTSQFPHVK